MLPLSGARKPVQLVAALLVLVWAVRLGAYLFRRILRIKVDHRFDEMRDRPAFASRHEPIPLSDLEKLLVLTAAGGNTGWHYMITRNAQYAPQLANYSGGAGGRTFPSAAGSGRGG